MASCTTTVKFVLHVYYVYSMRYMNSIKQATQCITQIQFLFYCFYISELGATGADSKPLMN